MKATSLVGHYNIWDFQKPAEVLGVGYLWKSILNLQLKQYWSTSVKQCNLQQLSQCWVPQKACREIKIPALIIKWIWNHETAIKLIWFSSAFLAVITSQFLKNIYLLFPRYVCAVGFCPRRILSPSYKSLNPENFNRNTYSFLTSLSLTLTL